MSNAQSKTVNITLPRPVLDELDAMAARDYTSRSDIIRQLILYTARHERADERARWAAQDGETWETLVDFRDEGYPGGMPSGELLKVLKEISNDRSKQEIAGKTTRKTA
jgi:Arc/MetJ-type ribon-helix-helix transcriptional regulator